MADEKKQVEIQPGVIIEFGSPEHRAWLGIDAEKDPVRRAALEEAWAAKPAISAKLKGKMPIGKAYNPAGEKIAQAEDFIRRGDGVRR